MSMTTPVTAQLARARAMFYFYSPLQTIFSSPTVSDTGSVSIPSTGSAERVNVKTYNLTIPNGADRIRVVVYGYVTGGHTCTVYISVDGVDVASATFSNSGEAIIIDHMGSISPGSRTIRIDVTRPPVPPASAVVVITRVFIATGIGLTSTTLTTIATFTLTYQLIRQGDIRYSPGVRVFVFGNRRTTAPLTLTIPEATNIFVGRRNLGAGNDNDRAETILAILTGSVTLQEGGEFTVSATLRGAVGATGDAIIITRIMARVQTRRFAGSPQSIAVYERGVCEYSARGRLVPVPGGTTSISHRMSLTDYNGRALQYLAITGYGTDVTIYNFRVAVVTPVHFTVDWEDDLGGEAFIEWVQLVVWG
jgi:hypothetical protein